MKIIGSTSPFYRAMQHHLRVSLRDWLRIGIPDVVDRVLITETLYDQLLDMQVWYSTLTELHEEIR